MEGLPLIPAMKIIDYLSIKDVLNLKLVNKSIRLLMRIWESNIYLYLLMIHFLTKDGFILMIQLINRFLFKYCPKKHVYLNLNQPVLSQLKQLFILSTIINLETLNSFDRLVHLEISESTIKSISTSFTACK